MFTMLHITMQNYPFKKEFIFMFFFLNKKISPKDPGVVIIFIFIFPGDVSQYRTSESSFNGAQFIRYHLYNRFFYMIECFRQIC